MHGMLLCCCVYSSLASGGRLVLSRFSYPCGVRVFPNAFFEDGECPSGLILDHVSSIAVKLPHRGHSFIVACQMTLKGSYALNKCFEIRFSVAAEPLFREIKIVGRSTFGNGKI